MNKVFIRTLLPALLLSGVSAHLFAAGFAIAEQGGKSQGAAFSGGAAAAHDASTIWFNPAGLTRLSGTHVSNGLHGIFPRLKYTDQGSTQHPAFGGGPLSGVGFDEAKNAAIPNFYLSHKLNDQWAFGLGINVPFGLVNDHEKDFIGRYHALRSDLSSLNINPTLAFKFNEKLSLGFGVNAQYVDVKLSNAIDMGATCLGLAATGLVSPATCAATGLTTPGNIATDSEARIEGNDWSWGYNIGILYNFNEHTRIGAHYRSKISHNIDGSSEIFHTHPGAIAFNRGLVAAGSQALSNQPIQASLALPESFSISAFHDFSDDWSIQTDITWTSWNRFKELRISFPSGQADRVTPQEWQNVLRYSLGTVYKMNNQWTLRSGLAYDQSPIPSAALRGPRLADEDRTFIAFGGTYSFSERLSLDMAYTHVFMKDPKVDYSTGPHANPEPGSLPESRLIGTYNTGVDIVSFQLNMGF